MSTRATASRPATPEPPFAHADPIAAWLDVLIRLLRVPTGERAEIRDELESHLRDRVRDLMLAGHAEDHATTRAIAELGEAAQLAERFRAARNRPFFRRHAMNLSILTVAGAATIMSAVALTTARGVPGAGPGSAVAVAANPPILGDAPILSHLFAAQNAGSLEGVTLHAEFDGAPIEHVFAALANAAGTPSIIRWSAFEPIGVSPGQNVELAVDVELPLPTVVRLLNESLDLHGATQIEYRVGEGILELATREYFDRRERTLVSYDLSPITAKGASGDEVVGLVTDIVEMDNWVDNGGDLATAHALGDRLFISAPPRMHERVSWILHQLEQPSARAATGDNLAAVPRPVLLDPFGSPISAWTTTPSPDPINAEQNATINLRITPTPTPASAR